MENTFMIIWLVLVSAFCILGLIGIVRRIRRSIANADEFRHAAEEGIVDSQEFPAEE